ncbi:hypothetical protein [Halalkalicoccus jeotgali]|uniref:Uncharacterized protein n=1 Tax=Halalkalicoccus jeotgali (strain DSM 18796 / CECT 7217 / JCM 14584 / KCTC 4019 / B3) TaxID=795797 RepID=D8J8K4_HALJB|nr:hypothetical protein [Halalkalicoccus jeotgali]ADJ16250.1 hypothetical protein HacjB3_14345 [Halalkalicoccus jeotgali B3]ELY36985.1 hypothetical protein C497_09578 [Halalkalicoccus jeotgali B3]
MVKASAVLVPVGIVGVLFGIVPLPGTGLLFGLLVTVAGALAWKAGY